MATQALASLDEPELLDFGDLGQGHGATDGVSKKRAGVDGFAF
jgi:hypothetical protein